MPRRLFKRFALKRHVVARQWFMSPFQHLLHDPRLWSVKRRWVVPAFSVGLFISFLPFPGHTLMGALAALALRINIPIAAVSTWVGNPATMGPMYYLAYKLGAKILGQQEQTFGFELSWNWVSNTFVTIWQPMLLGCLLLGLASALVGYITLDFLWRLSIGNYKNRKRKKRAESA